MIKFRNIALVLLAVCMIFIISACGESMPEQSGTASQPTEDTQKITETTGTADTQPVPVLYLIRVTDENGAPVPGAMVQMCSDTCVLGATDQEGVARFTLLPADYHVSVTVMPQGYDYADETTEFAFPEGTTELTIVLKAQS